jgi:small subunit ribosomal protein S4
MSKLGSHRKAWKVQRALLIELPGLGKPGALERRPYPPGQHGQGKKKFSEYGTRLREKQKMMFHYGLREEQLRRLITKAKKVRGGDWMAALVALLETRLDNMIFRLGFASSIPAARQLVRHGKVLVDGRKVSIASFHVARGSEITLTPAGYASIPFQYSIQAPRLVLPDWLEREKQGEIYLGRLRDIPPRDAVPFPFESQLVVEFYTGV